MSTQTIVIRLCSNCCADLADPDYAGTLCGRCADQMIVAEMKRRETVIAKSHRWNEFWVNLACCVGILALLAALYGALGWGAWEVGRHLVRLFE